MIHYRLTTVIAEGLSFVSDQFADTEVDAVRMHKFAFGRHHDLSTFAALSTTWVVLP